MLNWYLELSLPNRAALFVLLFAVSFVMFRSFTSLTGSHSHVTWYHGVHSHPIFQLLMWVGALPFIVPAIIIFMRRRRALRTAPFIGDLRTRKFHLPHCEYQQRISSDFLRYPLASKALSISSGFKPCNWCIPAERECAGALGRQS